MTAGAAAERPALAAGRSAMDRARKLAQMRAAQRTWEAAGLQARLRVLGRVRGRLATQGPAMAALVTRRSAAETLTSEVLPILDALRFLARRAPGLLAPRRERAARGPLWLPRATIEVLREPHGIVLIIGPANYPLMLPAVQAAQALAAGNAVIVKPGRGGRAAFEVLAGLFAEAGLPPGTLVIAGEDDAEAEALARCGVDKIVLTGSQTTGRRLLAGTASRPTPVTLELSGCDAAFVRADADPSAVASVLAFGLRLNGGATCIAPRRAFVAEPLAAALEARLSAALADAAPVALPAHTAAFARELIAEARAGGARLVCGSSPDAAHRQQPTVLANATADMRVARTELLAPVLALIPVGSDQEALMLARHCPLALGASVFGRDAAAAAELARRIDAGTVVVNGVVAPTADARAPFPARGASGFGVTRGPEGLLEMTRPKTLLRVEGRARYAEPLPDAALIAEYAIAAYGAGLAARARAAWRLASLLMRRGKAAGDRGEDAT